MGHYKSQGTSGAVAVSAKGASLSDLFETLAQATFSIEYDLSTVGFEREVEIEVEGHDLEGLLFEWLNALLAFYNEEQFVPGDFLVVEIGQPPNRRVGLPPLVCRGVMRGRLMGEWFTRSGEIVAGAMRDGVEVRTKKRGFEAEVVIGLA